MSADGRILLVLENSGLREECIRLAFELAKRLRCGVDALVLTGTAGAWQAEDANQVLDGVEGAAQEEGISLTREVRAGDPGSELLKHMATRGAARAVVWGGEESAFGTTSHGRKRHHWFLRVRGHVACPIVTATGPAAAKPKSRAHSHAAGARKT